MVDDSIFCVHGGIPRRAGAVQEQDPRYSNMIAVVNQLPKRMGVMPNYPHETQSMIKLVRACVRACAHSRALHHRFALNKQVI